MFCFLKWYFCVVKGWFCVSIVPPHTRGTPPPAAPQTAGRRGASGRAGRGQVCPGGAWGAGGMGMEGRAYCHNKPTLPSSTNVPTFHLSQLPNYHNCHTCHKCSTSATSPVSNCSHTAQQHHRLAAPARTGLCGLERGCGCRTGQSQSACGCSDPGPHDSTSLPLPMHLSPSSSVTTLQNRALP